MKKINALLGLSLASYDDLPKGIAGGVSVSGNFDGLNSRITRKRKPKAATNHKRSKKRKH